MNRDVRQGKYDKAIASLVHAKVAFCSWDKWEEQRKLTDAYAFVGELLYGDLFYEDEEEYE